MAMILTAIACGGQVLGPYNGATIGHPCTLALASDPTFLGFSAFEVSVELPNPDADPGVVVCLADHFRGRVSCPYGGSACTTPSGVAVEGDVEPQCVDRRASHVVTFSCRCANAAERTDDGATYCTCPSGTTCEQLVVPVGSISTGQDVSGAYCIPLAPATIRRPLVWKSAIRILRRARSVTLA